MKTHANLTRRAFLHTAASAAAAAAVRPASSASGTWPPPIVVFSKVYQEISLDFEKAADMTAAAGLHGIDCPVRPGGEIEPDRAAEDMPRYAEILRRRGVAMRLLTTGIVETSSPFAERILRTARQLGITHYRLGPWRIPKSGDVDLARIRAQLKDLAALNREIGVTAVAQNHSGNFVGGDLSQMFEIVKDFDPREIGVAFDLGHAIVTHGDEWPAHYKRLAPHIQVAYVKDVKRPKQFVALGEGEFGTTDWFARLRRLPLTTPISLHIEYDWSAGAPKTAEALLPVLRANLQVLRGWLAGA